MKVRLYMRERRAGNFSIEEIFKALETELATLAEVRQHVMRKRYDVVPLLKAGRERGAVHHVTGDIHYAALFLPGRRTLLTIHDLGSLTNDPKGLKRELYRKLWYDWPCRKVAVVTTISEFSKRCMVATLGLEESRIKVIRNPLLPGFAPCVRKRNRVPVILQIGSIHNKNAGRLVEAVRGLKVRLLLVNRLMDAALVRKLQQYSIDYEQRVDLSPSELRQAYAEADLVYFASTYEGFGMPIIEAQAVGRPVITSTVASMPEVAGDNHRLLVDPYSVEAIRSAIVRTIEDRSLYDQVVAEGAENVKRFGLKTVAGEYLTLYRAIADEAA